MLKLDSTDERQERIDQAVAVWLQERQKLLVLLCDIKQPGNTGVPTGTRVQSFCQLLMDYVSAGHFEIYDTLLHRAETQGRQATVERARQLYSQLQPSTDAALRFNDLFDNDEHCEDLQSQLAGELSDLGLALADRFTLEDHLLKLLREPHAMETL